MRLVSEDNWAVMTLYGECRGEPYDGKVAVGEVIRERARRRYSSDGTICGTVLRPFQFSCWNHADPNRMDMARINDSDPVVKECIKAWLGSLNSNLTNKAVLYLNPAAVHRIPNWADPQKKVAVIGAHHFFVD